MCMDRRWYHNVAVSPTPLISIMDCVSCIREPTEDDILLIHQTTMADEEAIQELDSEMTLLYSVLERLRLQKDKHRENIRRARSLLTLARRLPPELLARIFEICAKSGWTRAPVVVSQVCSAWRKAAASPRVWSYLFLDLRSGNPTGKVVFWLSKVQHAPLHITLDIPLESPSLEEVLSLLIPRSKQWHTLIIKSVDSTTMNYVLRRCNFPLPDLRQLDVITEMEGSQGDPVNMSSLQDASRLSRLLIEQPNLPQWNNFMKVTKLHIVLSSSTLFVPSINATDWIEMLQALPELRDLTLELSNPGTRTYNDSQRAVDLPHLESLTLHVSPEVNRILLTMHTPALRQLHLRCSSDPLARPHMPSGAHLCRFLESSPCVQLLELYDVDVQRIDFVRCFELLPKLEELRLHDSDIADEQLRLLHGDTGHCPNLARLDFRWCNYLTGSALVNLTKSRLPQNESEDRGSFTMPQTRQINEVAVINCLHVKEQDVLDLAEMTHCRVLIRSDEDHCYRRGCCNNERYRQRLRLRHNNKLPKRVIL
ncbi:uncharacterized protein F5891DRAFT_1001014 [Suillus fuscotomentosus]|uniref:F-box domain-containing protein n=1 Tax=Suillus fuscotomentosus TaxID=1912939 RepID=A0AAD4HSU3_9AGAM|nr:uncharacterized protein F5891DRAFT_1001014 [Suillus fuscotomentosus]KAG1907301.1 hypothetical protein F5891DRAFT_1001014 [Suillus fuscotomentosus]